MTDALIIPSQSVPATRRSRERQREVWTGVKVPGCSAEQIEQARAAGYEVDGDYFIGRDPRTMSQTDLTNLGHEQMSPMEAIRHKCLDCAGSSEEVRKCVALACPSWPFRTGKNPWRAPPSEAQREAARKTAARVFGQHARQSPE